MKLYGETFPNQGGIKKFEFLRKLPVTKAERHFRPKIWNLKQQDHPEKETTTNHRQRLISSKAKQIRWQMVFSTYCLLFLRSIYIYIFNFNSVNLVEVVGNFLSKRGVWCRCLQLWCEQRELRLGISRDVFGFTPQPATVTARIITCFTGFSTFCLQPEHHWFTRRPCRKKHTLSLALPLCRTPRVCIQGTFEWDCSRRKTVSSAQHKRNRAAEWWRDDELQCKQPRTAGCYFACPCPGAECVHGGWREECGAVGNAPYNGGALPPFAGNAYSLQG